MLKKFSYIYVVESLIIIFICISIFFKGAIFDKFIEKAFIKDKKLNILYMLNLNVVGQRQILSESFQKTNFKEIANILKDKETGYFKNINDLSKFDIHIEKNIFEQLNNDYSEFMISAYETIKYLKSKKTGKALKYFQNEVYSNSDKLVVKFSKIAEGTMLLQDNIFFNAKYKYFRNVILLIVVIVLFIPINLFFKRIMSRKPYSQSIEA